MANWSTPASLYLHIPFCQAKCNYCSFNSYPRQQKLFPRYLAAVKKELWLRRTTLPGAGQLKTLFIGGGTPSIIGAEQLVKLIAHCFVCFERAEDCEITIETNPEFLTREDYEKLLDAGVNRLSIGVQSFSDSELSRLGRLHTAAKAITSYEMARRAGFTNINLDLMYGLPGQSARSWQRTLKVARDLKPEHLSLYQLSIECNTPFFQSQQNNQLSVPLEAEIAEMDRFTEEACRPPFDQYEISNYALSDRRCRHNLTYWKNEAYLGIGAGAVGYQGGLRTRNSNAAEKYCGQLEAGHLPVAFQEKLAPGDSFRETVIMGLRLRQGVGLQQLENRYDLTLTEVYGDTVQKLRDGGLLLMSNTHLRLSERGWAVANLVMSELV